MVLKKFIAGTKIVSEEVNRNFNFSITQAGINKINQLIDRAVTQSAGQIEGFAEAYIDADGRNNSVVGGSTTAIFNVNAYFTDIFDISTEMTSDSKTFSVASQETAPSGFCFSSTGHRLYVAGGTTDIHMYSLSTPWDVTTASYTSQYSPPLTAPDKIRINSDGTKMFIWDTSTSVLYEYTFGTAYDVTTLSYSGTSFNPSEVSSANGVSFSKDGTLLFIFYNGNITKYSLSSAWNISSPTYTGDIFDAGVSRNVNITSDGKYMLVSTSSTVITEYRLNTPFLISSAINTGKTITVASFADGILNYSENKFYILESGATDAATQYSIDFSAGTTAKTITHTIPSGTFSATISSAILVPKIVYWETGVVIKYKLTNATEDTGWLSCSNAPQISNFAAFTSEPTSLILEITPKSSSPAALTGSISGIYVRAE